ncbi:MAG TPA: hypothetical protein VLK28_07865 [Methylomirabilota bacterium]|nr:hypothetical protein [Methylomirabilota bacterium]
MDLSREQVRIEEITAMAYADGRGVVAAPWPVSWSAIWVGALSALMLAFVFGLVAIALGVHRVGHPLGTWREVGFLALVFSVVGAFLAFALGGWAAARVAGIRRSEPAMLHGAIVWLVAVPILIALASMGATGYLGGWYGGLAGLPPAAAAQAFAAAQDPAVATAARNAALAAVAALLLGLMGAVIGGWMGSGEPMTFTHYRTRRDRAAEGGW